MFGALKRGRFRSLASLILVVNVVNVGELRRKKTLAASRGFLAAARLSCDTYCHPQQRLVPIFPQYASVLTSLIYMDFPKARDFHPTSVNKTTTSPNGDNQEGDVAKHHIARTAPGVDANGG